MYGILMVEHDDQYQVIGAVDSRSEAVEMAINYIHSAIGQEETGDFLAPETFAVSRRSARGWYTVREELDADELI